MENTTTAILTGLGPCWWWRPCWPGWCGLPTDSPTAADQRVQKRTGSDMRAAFDQELTEL
jgi:hypothetical protein